MELPKDQPDQPVQTPNTGSGLNLPAISTTPTPQESGKKLYLIIAIFLMVAMIGGGVFFFMKGSDGGNDSESIPSLEKASGGLQGKISEQDKFLKIKPKSFDDAKKEIETSTNQDKKTKGTEFLEKRAKDPKYKSDSITEFTFNSDNKGLYLFFPNRDMSFKEIRDSIVSVDNKGEIDVMFAGWNPELGTSGQWMATEQNYYKKVSDKGDQLIKELVADSDLETAVVKKGQGVVIMAPANILIPNGHDSTFPAGKGPFNWRDVKKGWVLLSAHGETLGDTFKDDCFNKVSTVFVQDNAKTADMKAAFMPVDLSDKAKFKATKLDKGFYAVWVYVNDQKCDGGPQQLKEKGGTVQGNAGAKSGAVGGEGKDSGGGGVGVDLNPTKVEFLYYPKQTPPFLRLLFAGNSNSSGYNIYFRNSDDSSSTYTSIPIDPVDKKGLYGITADPDNPGDGRYYFYNLPDGNYKFRIAGIDKKGVQAELKDAVESVEIKVETGAKKDSDSGAVEDLNPAKDSVSLTYNGSGKFVELKFEMNSKAKGYNIYYHAEGTDVSYALISVKSDCSGVAGVCAVIGGGGGGYYIFNLPDATYKFKIAGVDKSDKQMELTEALETDAVKVGAKVEAGKVNTNSPSKPVILSMPSATVKAFWDTTGYVLATFETKATDDFVPQVASTGESYISYEWQLKRWSTFETPWELNASNVESLYNSFADEQDINNGCLKELQVGTGAKVMSWVCDYVKIPKEFFEKDGEIISGNYVVQARGFDGEKYSEWSTQVALEIPKVVELNPTDLTFSDETYTYTDEGYGYVLLKWKPGKDAVDYKLYFQILDSDFAPAVLGQAESLYYKVFPSDNAIAIFNLEQKKGESYYHFKVVGVDYSRKEGDLDSAPVVDVSNLQLKALPDDKVVVVDNRIAFGVVDLMWKKGSEYKDYFVAFSVNGLDFVDLEWQNDEGAKGKPHVYINSNYYPGTSDLKYVSGGYRLIEVKDLPDVALKLKLSVNNGGYTQDLGIVDIVKK